MQTLMGGVRQLYKSFAKSAHLVTALNVFLASCQSFGQETSEPQDSRQKLEYGSTDASRMRRIVDKWAISVRFQGPNKTNFKFKDEGKKAINISLADVELVTKKCKVSIDHQLNHKSFFVVIEFSKDEHGNADSFELGYKKHDSNFDKCLRAGLKSLLKME